MKTFKSSEVSGSSKVLKKGPVSTSNMRNGEEIIQYHNGKLKIIRKEFGKMFELEFKRSTHRELETFAKFSDVKTPQRNAIKVFKDGVKIANSSDSSDVPLKTYMTPPNSGDSNLETGQIVKTVDGVEIQP